MAAASVGRGANTRKQRREGSKVSNVDVDTTHFMAAGEGDSNGSEIEIVFPSCSIRPPTRLRIVMEEGGAIVPETPGGNVEELEEMNWMGGGFFSYKSMNEFLLKEEETIVKKFVEVKDVVGTIGKIS